LRTIVSLLIDFIVYAFENNHWEFVQFYWYTIKHATQFIIQWQLCSRHIFHTDIILLESTQR